jgi:DNA-binding LytR/AlgR family response regulator
VADDEAPLRAGLIRQLQSLAGQLGLRLEVVAEAAHGAAALAAWREAPAGGIDAAFLDIRMPELSGLEVAARIAQEASPAHPACQLVFVTAYDEFAVAAFEQAAVDYLVKPVTPERLEKTLRRLTTERPPSAPNHNWEAPLRELQALLGQLPATAPVSPTTTQPLRWLRVGNEQAVQLLDVHSVDFFRAADKYTEAWSGGQPHLVRLALGELETQLDPDRFWRIHRSVVVRVDAIHEARRDLMGRLFVHLHGGGEALPVSRSHAHLFNRD